MKRNWLLYLVIFSLALNFGTIGTFAYLRNRDQSAGRSQQIPPPLAMQELWKGLNLDASQRRAARGMFLEHRARVAKLRGELFQKRQELFEQLKGEAPALAVLKAKIGEISALQGQLEEELVGHLLEFRKHLKPEQRATFLDLVQTRMDKAMGGPCGPRGGHGPRRGPWMGRGPGLGPEPPPPGPPGMGPGPRGPECPD